MWHDYFGYESVVRVGIVWAHKGQLEKDTPMHNLPETGFLRLRQIIGDTKAKPPIPAVIPVSKSTWWNGVRTGRYPQPVRTLGHRITAWPVESIRALISESKPPVGNGAK